MFIFKHCLKDEKTNSGGVDLTDPTKPGAGSIVDELKAALNSRRNGKIKY
jgi:hypothetical protein